MQWSCASCIEDSGNRRFGPIGHNLRSPPIHPGEILLEEFLRPMGISQIDIRHVTRYIETMIKTFADKRTQDLGDHLETGRMSIRNTSAMKRRPTHPGVMLREDFMPPYGLTVATLAEAVGVSRQSINELLLGRRVLSTEMALRFARLFGNSAEFWLNAQRAVDLWDANETIKDKVASIEPLQLA